jgi:hypothetical protein
MSDSSLSDVSQPLLVLIAGPYLSGTDGDPRKIARNRERLESFALPIYERGHLPMLGDWHYRSSMQPAGAVAAMPSSGPTNTPSRLLECRDAVLRIPGESRGADSGCGACPEAGFACLHRRERATTAGVSAAGNSVRGASR